MATITAKAVTGNLSSNTNWVGDVAPVSGDKIVIGSGANITVDANATVSVQLTGTGVLSINANSATLTIPPGGTFDAPPSAVVVMGYHNNINFNGTLAQPCVAQAPGGSLAGGTTCVFDGTNSGSGGMQASYTTFRNITLKGIPSNALPFIFSNCTLDGSQLNVLSVSPDSIVRVVSCQWLNVPAATADLTVNFYGAMVAGGVRLVQYCSFSGTPTFYPATDSTINQCYFPNSYGTTSGAWADFRSCLARKTVAGNEWPVEGPAHDVYWLNDHNLVNPHGIGPTAARAVTISGGVYQYTGTATDGDFLLAPSPASPFDCTLTGVVQVANANGVCSGTLVSLEGNANTRVHVTGNTSIFGGSGNERGGLRVGEPGTSWTGTVPEDRDNLWWGPPASGGYKSYDMATTPAVDVSPVGAHKNNAAFNGAAGTSGNGYNALNISVGTPGTGDVDLGTGADPMAAGPRFIDSTRNLGRWGQVRQGTDGTTSAALAKIAADPTLIPDAVTWTRAGFVVQAPSLATASSTGGAIGAMPYQAAASPLAAGSVSVSALAATSLTLTATQATGGTGPYVHKFQKAPDVSGAPGVWSDLLPSGAALTFGVTGLTPSTKYWFRDAVTDSAGTPATSYSAAVTATTPALPAGASVSITGNNRNGVITLTTGPAPAAGVLATVTFSPALAAAPAAIVVGAAGPAAAGVIASVYADSSAWSLSSWALKSTGALAPSTAYRFSYQVGG